MRIRTQCRACGLPFKACLSRQLGELVCPNCADSRPLDLSGWPVSQPQSIEVCPVCICHHLYRQRDVNRAWGCLLVLIGAILVPWTYGLSLVALALVDLVLFHRLAEVVVCYRCDTVFRDAKPGPRQNEFDLLKHDVLKYGKSWQDLEED